jgi:hypothetical protein
VYRSKVFALTALQDFGLESIAPSLSLSSLVFPSSQVQKLLSWWVCAGTGLSPNDWLLEDRLSTEGGTRHDVGKVDLFFGCRTEKDFI